MVAVPQNGRCPLVMRVMDEDFSKKDDELGEVRLLRGLAH
jgi:hypothetical protein